MSSKYDPDQDSRLLRMGYWISEKKSKKLNITEFTTFCRNAGIQLIKVDLDDDLESQGPFDLIFHKLTDILAKAKAGNEKAKTQIQCFQNYASRHPEVAVVDPLDNLLKLMDRHFTYQFVRECELLDKEYRYFMPSFVEFNTTDVETNKRLMEESEVQFPFICKPSVAHGSSQCHQMAIIFNEEGLKDVDPPCVAQTFINHDAVLYKIFIIGRQHYVVPRPSLKNFGAGNYKTIRFDSACISKPYSCSFLNVLDENDMRSTSGVEPDMGRLRHLAKELQAKLGLDLIGLDVIIENNTGRYAIIDINAFPGYENGIDNLYGRLVDVFLDKLKKHGSRPLSEPLTSVPNTVPKTNGSPSDTTEGNKAIIPNQESSDCDVSRMKEELHKLEQFDSDNKCDSEKKRNSKEQEQLLLCNNKNCPLNPPGPDEDSLIWDGMLNRGETKPDSSCPHQSTTWPVD